MLASTPAGHQPETVFRDAAAEASIQAAATALAASKPKPARPGSWASHTVLPCRVACAQHTSCSRPNRPDYLTKVSLGSQNTLTTTGQHLVLRT